MHELQELVAIEYLAEALEQMAFIGVSPLDEPPPAPLKPVMLSIDFRGQQAGTVQLLAPLDLGAGIAANALGTDPQDPEAQSRAVDALRELLNVACGLLLTAASGGAADACEMSIPKLAELDPAQWQPLLAGGDFAALDADGYPAAIRVTLSMP